MEIALGQFVKFVAKLDMLQPIATIGKTITTLEPHLIVPRTTNIQSSLQLMRWSVIFHGMLIVVRAHM